MRRRALLLLAVEADLRARIAPRLQATGYAIELASDLKRSLKLAADYHFQVAIVAPGSSPPSLAMMRELRDTVPEMIVLAKGPDEIACLRRSLPGLDAIFLEESKEDALIIRLNEMMELANRTAHEPACPGIVHIEDCTLDLAGGIFVDAEGREVALTRAEMELLIELARNPGQFYRVTSSVMLWPVVARILFIKARILSIEVLTCLLHGFGARLSAIQRFPNSS